MKQSLRYLNVLLMLLSVSCANIVPPSGGPKDTTPPKLLSLTPSDSLINIRPSKITLIFDKYMEVDNNSDQISISPLLERMPTILNYGKKIVININDSALLPNTTYTLSLINVLKDNREGTPYPDFTFRFSTGSYFDSLSLKGKVINAHTGIADTGTTVMLYYSENFTDSMVFNKKPAYITKTKSDGTFSFEGLPDRNFRIFALTSKEKSLNYVPGNDWFAFKDEIIRPSLFADSLIVLNLFKEDVDIDIADEFAESGKSSMRNALSNAPQLNDKEMYRVMVDTINKKSGTQELNKPITILTNNKFRKADRDKIFLSFEKEGVELEAPFTYERNDTTIRISTKWQSSTTYTLRLVKGWAEDTSGAELLPGKYIFITKKEEDYGNMEIKFPAQFINRKYLFQLSLGSDSIALLPVRDSVLNFSLLKAGNYTALLIQDLNADVKFTTGDYIKGLQPEPVIPNANPLIVKAGWTHEYDFEIKKDNVQKPNMR